MNDNLITTWATVVTAWATVATAIIALWATVSEARRSRFSHGIDILMKLEKEFHDRTFKKKRSQAAIILEKKLTQPISKEEGDQLELIGSEILDFFQGVGTLTRKGVLDKTFVYKKLITAKKPTE